MTSKQETLRELEKQLDRLAEKITTLKLEIEAHKPTTGLLGRWATHPEYGDVLITGDKSDNGLIQIVYLSSIAINGTYSRTVNIDYLEFPDQITRPQDVPVGEAWLVDAHNGFDTQPNTPALKIAPGLWATPTRETADESEWHNHEITLVTPLIPARPHDIPETVTTEEEYEALPEGTIVAENNGAPWQKLKSGEWISHIFPENRPNDLMDGLACRILRRGWGK